MSLGTQIAWDDAVLPFQLDDADVRGRFVRLSGVIDEVLCQHDYPDVIESLLRPITMARPMMESLLDCALMRISTQT